MKKLINKSVSLINRSIS